MRLALDQLDARGLDLNLAPAASGLEQRLRLRTASGLHGLLELGPEVFQLSDVEADWVVLDASALDLGSVTLTLTREATLGELRASYARSGHSTRLEVSSHGLHAALLEIVAGTVQVRGEARMQNTRLTLSGSEGRIEAEQARIEGFHLQIGTLVLSADELVAEALVVGWGEGGFLLSARRLSGPALELSAGPMKLSARGVSLRELSVRGPHVAFAEASVDTASLEMSFGGEPSASVPERTTSAPAPKLFDYALLDGLSGRLHVDAVVDMTVPILGNRRATHELRVEVDEGTIDFRELEADLSALEESLLDFAVRDEALVLERGIPLLPTRGFGKPLVIWDLSPYDLALAHKRRVRLSVLPGARLAKELTGEREEREERESRFAFALRRLGLENLALELSLRALQEPTEGALKRVSFEQLKVRGGVQHELKGPARPGEMQMELAGLETSVEKLPLGSLTLDVPSLRLARLRDAALSFTGLRPTQLRATIDGLVLERFTLA